MTPALWVIGTLLMLAVIVGLLAVADQVAHRSGTHVIRMNGFPDGYVPPSASLDPPGRYAVGRGRYADGAMVVDVPGTDEDAAAVAERFRTLPPGPAVVVRCRSGSEFVVYRTAWQRWHGPGDVL